MPGGRAQSTKMHVCWRCAHAQHLCSIDALTQSASHMHAFHHFFNFDALTKRFLQCHSSLKQSLANLPSELFISKNASPQTFTSECNYLPIHPAISVVCLPCDGILCIFVAKSRRVACISVVYLCRFYLSCNLNVMNPSAISIENDKEKCCPSRANQNNFALLVKFPCKSKECANCS